MSNRRWINNTQPQTLQIAVVLLYMNAVFLVIQGYLGAPLGVALVAAQAAGAYGVANERKWGYGLAVAGAALPLLLLLTTPRGVFGAQFLTVMFQVALLGLLLHRQSREYQRIWFK